jgi:hypothetical protein
MNIDVRIFHFQHGLKWVLLYIFVVAFCLENSNARDYYQRQSGEWNNPTTWTTETKWKGTINAGTYPQAGDNVHFANNGNTATITLTDDAVCNNLHFDNSSALSVLALGNFDLTVNGSWTTNWATKTTISQGSGYLQVNSGIGNLSPGFNVSQTISNLRVGSASFAYGGNLQYSLTVTSNYDHNCFTSVIPTGIIHSSATKLNATPCTPVLSATTLESFGTTCTGNIIGPKSFTINGLALSPANITVSSLTSFSFSTSENGTYSNSLSLAHAAGNFSQVIYVKFSPYDPINYSGNIVIGGGGASNINLAASGTGASSVLPIITTPVASDVLTTTAQLGGTIELDGCATQSVTERGIYYSTTNGFANGSGTKVSETGTFGIDGFLLNVTGLTPNTTYYFKAFATNSSGTSYTPQATFNNTPFTYYSQQSGNWTDPNTWLTDHCGGSTNYGSYPKAGDNVVICQSHNVTVNAPDQSCKNLEMVSYLGRMNLNYDFTVNGNLSVDDQSYVTVGTHNLTISGNYLHTGYDARIEYSSGNVMISGNISTNHTGIAPFICTGTGWLILNGTSQSFSVSGNNLTIPRLRQPSNSFTKTGNSSLTISNTFDRNCGNSPTVSGGIFSISGSTINAVCYPDKHFRSVQSGNWNSTSTWQQSTDQLNWSAATSPPVITDGSVLIQNAHTVTLTANAGASSLTVNGTLNLSTYQLNGSTTLTLSPEAVLKINGESNFPTGFATVDLNTNSTVEYLRTNNQTVAPYTYSHLSLSGQGVKTTTGVTVTGTLSIQDSISTNGIIVPNVASTIVRYKGPTLQSISDGFILGNKVFGLTVDSTAKIRVNCHFTLNDQLLLKQGGSTTINSGKALVVLNNIDNQAGAAALTVKASETLASGSLIFHNNENNPVQATVEFYSKASFDLEHDPGDRFHWQFFGIPFRTVTAGPTFNNAYIRKKIESGTTTANHWLELNSGSVLTSFTGYQICQENPKFYTITGTLENSSFNSGQLAKTPSALYPGQHLFANPYTASIDIRAIEFGSDIEETVYLYNTGTYQQWDSIDAGSFGNEAGQYIAVPKNSAGNAGLPRHVPSMGSMLFSVFDSISNPSTNSYVSISYNSVMPNEAPMRAPVPLAENANVVASVIEVRGKHAGDKMWLFCNKSSTRNFDNGYDGYKLIGQAFTPQLFAVEKDGNYQINTVPSFHQTNLAFRSGIDTDYTMTFTHNNLGIHYSRVFLHDRFTNTITDITTSGSTYRFSTSSSPQSELRFTILTEDHNSLLPDTPNNGFLLFNNESGLFVKNLTNEVATVLLYDVSGRLVSRSGISAGALELLVTDPQQIYIARIISNNRILTRQVKAGF